MCVLTDHSGLVNLKTSTEAVLIRFTHVHPSSLLYFPSAITIALVPTFKETLVCL